MIIMIIMIIAEGSTGVPTGKEDGDDQFSRQQPHHATRDAILTHAV